MLILKLCKVSTISSTKNVAHNDKVEKHSEKQLALLILFHSYSFTGVTI